MIDAGALTRDTQRLVQEVEDDLRDLLEAEHRSTAEAVEAGEVRERWVREHQRLTTAGRTSAAWPQWRNDRLTQVAVSWVLTTVFLRFIEDNRMVAEPWITGPGERGAEAREAQDRFFRAHPELTDRDWVLTAVDALQRFPATKALVDRAAPLRQLAVSGPMAQRIIAFWRSRDDEGALVHDFTDPALGTRFLGDLYENLSVAAQKQYALKQTPVFVEELILDETLEPALDERPLEGFRLIDPTCGSGHFLLGAFARLVERWQRQAPAANPREHVIRALGSVFGVDLNPFAVAIARFRLIVAALAELGETELRTAPDLSVNLAVGDSLLRWGVAHQDTLEVGDALPRDEPQLAQAGSLENASLLAGIIQSGRYDAVVGNPPYIVPPDEAAKAAYRESCRYAKGQYQLTVPFMERFFALARPVGGKVPVGWVGQITGNAFMDRQFGKLVVDSFLPTKDLRLVIDTSGAYIPGHGTPTVILVGVNQHPVSSTLRAVLGIKGEPGVPADPAQGKVWSSIAAHRRQPGYEDDFVSVVDLDRGHLARHPWSLTGGAAPKVLAVIAGGRSTTLASRLDGPIGFASFPGADEVFISRPGELDRSVGQSTLTRPIVLGEGVRDFATMSPASAFVPYDERHDLIALDDNARWFQRVWRMRTNLQTIKGFDGRPRSESGAPWWSWYRWVKARYTAPLLITFAFVATHNHFALDRGGKVFKQSAPVIKLPVDASEDDHLDLLGALNSSTACFWLKQNSHDKGNGGIGGGIADTEWERFYEFTGTTLKDFPLTGSSFLVYGRTLDTLAREHAAFEPEAALTTLAPTEAPSATVLATAQARSTSLRRRMIAVQEELDWAAYRAYGLTDEDLTHPEGLDALPEVALGERPFEILMARGMEDGTGEDQSAWFERHRSTPVTEIPAHGPETYRATVQRRLDAIAANPLLALLERPEYKRRWAEDPWELRVDRALRAWLLDQLEDPALWHDAQGRPQTRTVAQLAEHVGRTPRLRDAVALWRSTENEDLTTALAELLKEEAVPALAAQRLKPKAVEKFRTWQRTWELQRLEDADEKHTIPVPPKYTTADWAKPFYHRHRGKLDVPKERFIAYPDTPTGADTSPRLGWAGWDHFEQLLALLGLAEELRTAGAPDELRLPVAAAADEVLFWVEQWHDTVDPAIGINRATFARQQVDALTQALNTTRTELRAWRPAKTKK